MTYKVKQTVKFDNVIPEAAKWPPEGQVKTIHDEKGKLVAKYVVKQVDRNYIYGVIITTYGHKRRNST